MKKSKFALQSEVNEVYQREKNFLIVNHTNRKNKAVIFFSSNSIFFPDDIKTFRKTIVQNDRYEWTTAISQLNGFDKLIFVRDINKCWYERGINSNVKSLAQLSNFLAHETLNFSEIYYVGVSAGGYAALIAGTLNDATCIFAINPQLDVTNKTINSPQIEKSVVERLTRKRDLVIFPTQSKGDKPHVEWFKSKIGSAPVLVKGYEHKNYLYAQSVYQLIENNKKMERFKNLVYGKNIRHSIYYNCVALGAKNYVTVIQLRIRRKLHNVLSNIVAKRLSRK